MDTSTLVTLIGALGLGSLIGSFISANINKRTEERKMLFESRVKAYSSITGRVFNFFLEPDITSIKDEALISAKINAILSETLLLSSPELVELVSEFKVKVFDFHRSLSKKNNKETMKIHDSLLPLAGKVFDGMRKDVYVTNKSAWSKK